MRRPPRPGRALVACLGLAVGCSGGTPRAPLPPGTNPAPVPVARDILARIPWTERLFGFGGGETTGFTFPTALEHVGRDGWMFASAPALQANHLAVLVSPEGNDVRTACVDSVMRSEITSLSSTVSWKAPCDGLHAHTSDDEVFRVEVMLTFRGDGPRSERVSVERSEGAPAAG